MNDWICSLAGVGAVSPINPIPPSHPYAAHADAQRVGSGRYMTLNAPVPLGELVAALARGFGVRYGRRARATRLPIFSPSSSPSPLLCASSSRCLGPVLDARVPRPPFDAAAAQVLVSDADRDPLELYAVDAGRA